MAVLSTAPIGHSSVCANVRIRSRRDPSQLSGAHREQNSLRVRASGTVNHRTANRRLPVQRFNGTSQKVTQIQC